MSIANQKGCCIWLKLYKFFGSTSELFLLLKEITKCSNRCISADPADAHFAGSQSRLLEIGMLRLFLRDQQNVSKYSYMNIVKNN